MRQPDAKPVLTLQRQRGCHLPDGVRGETSVGYIEVDEFNVVSRSIGPVFIGGIENEVAHVERPPWLDAHRAHQFDIERIDAAIFGTPGVSQRNDEWRGIQVVFPP